MALIKQSIQKKDRKVKKEVVLPQTIWSEITSYIKYADIKGTQTEKRDFIMEECIKAVFASDKGFQEYMGRAEKQPQPMPSNK